MSNGGYMSFLLACQLSDRIAAIASVTGSMTPQTYNLCNPQRPIPVLQIHGTNDQKCRIKVIENGLYQLIKYLNIG